MSDGFATGGCQCGAVRYRLKITLARTHFCHCRMCQRATGGVFAALAWGPRADFAWTRGEPALFDSSSLATRGFCRDCGTPLSFAYRKGGGMNVTIGSLDHPQDAPISIHYGVESRVPWLKLCDGLPEARTDAEDGAEMLADMVSHQGAEGA